MKILVTGANGFLGSWVTRALIKNEHQVRILARPQSDLSELKDLTFERFTGDVTDLNSVEKAVEGTESVFHLAGLIAYNRSLRPMMEKVNILGTENVLSACQKTGVKNLLYLSSVVAVGAGLTKQQILNEDSKYNIGHLHLGYFDTKHIAEQKVIEAHEKGLVEAVILNPSTVYGPGDARKGSRKTQLKVARGEFPFYTQGGVNVIAIEDLISSLLTAWTGRHTGERFILAGENLSIRELFSLIAEAAGVAAPRWPLPNAVLFAAGAWGDLKSRLGKTSSLSIENAWSSTLYHWFDNSKAKRVLGLNPRPAKFAIQQSVAWMKEHHLLDPSSDK